MFRSVPFAAALVLIGAVFTLQGIGMLGGSAMTGSPFWAVVGVILIVAGVIVGWRALRPAPRG